MKKRLFSLAATALSLLTALTSSAQTSTVPNGNLNAWQTRSTVEVPQDWTTTDEAIKASPFGFFYATSTTTKATDSRTGFAARLETKTDPVVSGIIGGPVPGALFLGRVTVAELQSFIGNPNANGLSALGGLPFTARATNMQFYYKLTGANAAPDSAYALVSLTRTVAGTVQTVAVGSLRLLPAATYTLGNIPLFYTSTLAPDSVHIAFASGVARNRTAGTTLLVDDVVMTGTVSSTRDAQLTAALQVYPNPNASGVFTLAARGRETALNQADLTVMDALGRVVARQSATRTTTARTLDLQAQPAGLYTLRLETPNGFVVQKLMKL